MRLAHLILILVCLLWTHHFLNFAGFIHFFQTADTYANTLIVSKLWDLNKVLGALATYGRSTFAAMVLPLPKSKLEIAHVALDDFFSRPERSLSNLKALDPSLVCFLANIFFSDWHSNYTCSELLVDISSRYLTMGTEIVRGCETTSALVHSARHAHNNHFCPMLVCTVLNLDGKLESCLVMVQEALLSHHHIFFWSWSHRCFVKAGGSVHTRSCIELRYCWNFVLQSKRASL